MSYRVYIKHDYKPVVRWYPDQPWYIRRKRWVLFLGLASLATIYYLTEFSSRENISPLPAAPKTTVAQINRPVKPAASIPSNTVRSEPAVTDKPQLQPSPAVAVAEIWQTVTVKPGENLSLIFDHLHISPAVLAQVMTAGAGTEALTSLAPGDRLQFRLNQGDLLALRYEQSLTSSLQITKQDSGYRSETIVTKLEKRLKVATGRVSDSLYQAGQDAGLSDNLIMRLIGIYGWDIDFALDIRAGDNFKVLYQEQFKDGKKVGEGPILASEFNNRGKTYRAVLYTSPDGHSGYYNENGYSMRKAFLRTPLKFTRISSRFNLHRLHPILGITRPHEGVDYAAPRGTPIKATGDGVVAFLGRKGGYGRTIILKHGGRYSTLYGHMSAYAHHLHVGSRVEQGQIIGYVGMSGLATGPHLHYEFRVNGVHRNPLTVKLPKALRIPDQQMAIFHQRSRPLLAKLDRDGQTELATHGSSETEGLVLAQRRPDKADDSVR